VDRKTTPTGKRPFRFTMKGGGFFCMAGLWEKWIRPPRTDELNLDDNEPSADQLVETLTIITT
jgi:putative SOS response-associated peptidase YedK